LPAPARDEQEVAGAEDGAEALGEHVVGRVVDGVEEPRVVPTGLLGERLDPRERRQGRAGLVEGEVAVGPDAEHLKVDAAGGEDRLLVATTGRRQSLRVRVGAGDPVAGDPERVGELAEDRLPVGMAGGQPDVRRTVAGGVAADDLVVRRQRARARGQPEDRAGWPATNASIVSAASAAVSEGITTSIRRAPARP
jgi:hypothetical protein